MKPLKLNPPHFLLSAIVIAFTTIMSLQIMLYINGPVYADERPASSAQEQVIWPTATIMTQVIATPPPRTIIEPTQTTSPTENEIRIGYMKHGMNCPFITEIVGLVLQQELNTKVARISFDSAEELFTALAEKKVDLTLCVMDPNNRTQIKTQLGYISQIGFYYWSDGRSKLQIWANGAAKADLREQQPCVLRFLETLHFNDVVFQDGDANTWLKNHANDEVQAWISCVPEN